MKNLTLMLVAFALILTVQACAKKYSPAAPAAIAALAQK